MPSPMTTAERHKAILDYLDDYQAREWVAPSKQRIADHCGMPSSTVGACLEAMQRYGKIRRRGTATRPWYEIVDKPK